MTTVQTIYAVASISLLLGIALAAQFGWLGRGAVFHAAIFLAAVLAIFLLRIARVPPSWFSGSKTGFGFACLFLVSAYLGKTSEERAFRRSLFLGLGLTLLAANVLELVFAWP